MKKTFYRVQFLALILLFILFAYLSCEATDHKKENHPPKIISSPITTAILDEPYIYQVKARDEDEDFLTYSLKTFPEGMRINPLTGEIIWTPRYKQLGNHYIEILVKDQVLSTSQKFAIRVIPVDNGVPFQRGFNFTSWGTEDYLKPRSDKSLKELKANGVEWVSILVTWYQQTLDSTTIEPIYEPPITPSDTALIHAIKTAQALGLNVVLKPHIDVLTGEWRGKISFPDDEKWGIWFKNYQSFLGHYLDLAEANGVKIVIIGTELKVSESRETEWREVIDFARGRFSGLLTYCANHDSFFMVNWWDALDFIGVSAYFALTDSNEPTIEDLKNAWESPKKVLRSISAFYEKDVVFTEIGYTSQDGTNKAPYKYDPSAPLDLEEQADCYQSALEVFYNEPWFKGMYWWAWYWNPNIDSPTGFTIYNKPAEKIVRKWYAGY